MNKIQIGSRLVYTIKQRTSFLFCVAVGETDCQHIDHESFITLPHTSMEIVHIGLSNNRMHRMVVEPGEFMLKYEANVTVNAEKVEAPQLQEQPHRELPAEVLPYLNPSRYCESDRLGTFAFSEFGRFTQGYSRVKAICDWTHEHLAYVPGATNSLTTACDVLLQRTGVCRDFTHVAIALCRGLGIPARYVSGYALNLCPPDFHGFFEAYLGDRWYLFDPTQLAPVGGLVRIASGQDAADVAFATLVGAASLKERFVEAQSVGNVEPLDADVDQSAISTASVAN